MKLRLLPLLLLPMIGLAQIAPIQRVDIDQYTCSNTSKAIEISQVSLQKENNFRTLTNKEAVNVVQVLQSYQDLDELYYYLRDFSRAGETDIFSDQNTRAAVAHFKANVIPNIDANLNNKDLIRYVYYFRAFDWHAYYQSSVSMTDAYKNEILDAFKDLNANPVFWSNTSEMEAIKWEAVLIADIEHKRGLIWPELMQIMQTRGGDASSAVSSIMWRGLMNKDYSMLTKLFADTSFINALRNAARSNDINIARNYINLMGLILEVHRNYTLPAVTAPFNLTQYLGVLNELLAEFQFGSAQHIKLIGVLFIHQSYYSFNVNFNAIKDQYYTDQFQSVKSFNNGEIKLHSSLSEERINMLYLALREAKSNFFKLSTDITPIAGDPNPTINLYVFKNAEDYTNLGGMFFNIPTNNGGIYIENDGSLYTFDRESELLPIDMLLKHEYVHYLDGRYNIHGTFGELPFYDWGPGRYVWWTEGLANYVASAEPSIGFNISAYGANWISSDNGNSLSLETSLRNSYNYGGRMYAYSEAAWGYLNTTMPATVNQMFKLVRSNQTQQFWTLLDSIAFNKDLQPAYTAYLEQIANGWRQGKIKDPLMRDYTFTSTSVTSDELKSLINELNLIEDYSDSVNYTQPYKFIKLTKSITYTQDLGSSLQKINQELEDTMIKFHQSAEKYTGFEAITAWIESVEVNGDQVTFKASYEIPLNGQFVTEPDPVDPDPVDPDPVDPDPVDPIDPEPEVLEMVLYPNPTVDLINIAGINTGDQITIFSINGMMIHNQPSTGTKFSYDMSRYPIGIYVVNLLHKGKRYSKKFIKR